jgi:hypothetical protein
MAVLRYHRPLYRAIMLSATFSSITVFRLEANAQTSEAHSAASPDGEDEITLKNGGMLRGTVLAEDPGKQVVIQIQGTGEKRTMLWSQVEKIERSKHIRKRPAPRLPPLSLPPVPAMACQSPYAVDSVDGKHGAVRIHIETTDGSRKVHLYRWMANTSWLYPEFQEMAFRTREVLSTGSQEFGPPLGEHICSSPCDRIVDGRRGQTFLLSGYGITDSDSFQLLDWQGHVTLRVAPGNALAHAWGWNLIKYVSAFTVVSGAFTDAASIIIANHSAERGGLLFEPISGTIGVGLIGMGLTTFVTGIVLYATNRTTYEIVKGKPPAKHPSSLSRSGRFLPRF